MRRGLLAGFITLAAAGGLACLLGTPVMGAEPPLAGSVAKFSLANGQRPAPSTRFIDPAGKPVTLAALRGKLLLVNFWATWCVPCVHELPSLERLQTALGSDKFQVVLVSEDRGEADEVRRFLTKIGLPKMPSYRDPPLALFRAFDGHGLPTTVLIDPQGNEIGRLEGDAAWDQPDALALIRHFLQ
ncbi:MAG: TlpA family protein disulfide reductase [Alphaproteobacteria bacterium]|nr:TlpA family protein disulfide reductase [Alphaproteobacteria bacterium]